MRLRIHQLFLFVFFMGCQLNTASRFPDDVQSGIRSKDMRRMETDNLVLYYSEGQKDAVKRFAVRVGSCQEEMQAHLRIRNEYALQKPVIVLPEVPFNNAFVAPGVFGERTVSVVPLAQRIDLFGIPFDASYVACHEIVHYVHFLQVSGFWHQVNKLLGDTFNPHLGSDAWVFEGLATYYESKLTPGTGRMAWPLWRAFLKAGYAGKNIDGGDLSVFKRPFHAGNHYLVGSHFIEYIANTYGEQALWSVVQGQGNSISVFFSTSSNWSRGTGKSLPQLIKDFSNHLKANNPVRKRPPSQKKKQTLSNDAKYALSRDGTTEAVVHGGGDQQTTLEVIKNGQIIRQRKLVDLLPPSQLVVARPSVSGLSLTSNGSDVYFVTVDMGAIYQESRLMHYDVQANKMHIVSDDIVGMGGGISDDGTTYFYSESVEDTWRPATFDIKSKTRSAIYQPAPETYFSNIRPSPNNDMLAATLYKKDGYGISVLDLKTNKPTRTLKLQGPVTEPTWKDSDNIVFLGEVYGRFQIHVWDLRTDKVTIESDVPYSAINAWAHGNTFHFLNRESWHWTLDSLVSNPSQVTGRNDVAITVPHKKQAPTLKTNLNILSDTPYSHFDGLVMPTLRTPFFLQPLNDVTLFGLSLFGGDRLSIHRWALSVLTDKNLEEFSGHASYTLSLFAPYVFSVHARRLSVLSNQGELFRQQSVMASIGRRHRLSQAAFNFLGIEDKEPERDEIELRKRRLAGPGLVVGHFRGDATGFGGLRRGYDLSATGFYFDQKLNTLDRSMWYLGAQANITVPVPWTKRQSIEWKLDGQMFTNTSMNTPLLEVGAPIGQRLWSDSDPLSLSDDSLLPGSGLFQIPLRGFEDKPFRSDRILTSHLIYKFPIVIDQGVASFLYLLPSLYIRNIDLDLFASMATRSLDASFSNVQSAAGASVTLQSFLGFLLFDLRYQLSKRLQGDKAWSHWLSMGQSF